MVSLNSVLKFKALSRWLSDENLTKKASLNALAAALDYGARLVIGFVINPLLVNGLGDYGYGVWQVLGRLAGYISPASGRPTQALKWTIANQQASTDYEGKRRQVGNAVAVWLLFLPVLVFLGGLLTWGAPFWLNAPAEAFLSIRLATALLAVNVVMISLVELPRGVLSGENLGYKRMGLSALLVFVGGGFTVLALHLNAGLVGVATATLTTTLLTGALFLQVVRTYVPWFGIARPLPEAVRQFLGLSWWFLLWNLVMRLMRASDVVILGIFGSAELVTSYSLTKYAPETIISFVAIVVFGITPGLGGIIGSGNLEKAIRVRNEIMLFTWLLVTATGSTILLWNRSFVQLWVGTDYYAGPIPTLLIVIITTQFVIIRNDANVIDLTLNLRHKVLIGLLSTALSVLGAAILVGRFNLGIIGLSLSFIAGRSILSLGYPWLVGRFLGTSLSIQLKSVLRPTIVTVVLFVLMSSAVGYLTVSSWPGLVFSSGATLIGVSFLTFYAGLSGEQRKHIWHRIRRIMQLDSAN